MARWVKILSAAVASFAFLFISIGYAAVAGTLGITGTVTYNPDIPLAEGVHISDASVNDSMTEGEGSVITFGNTTLTTTVDTSNGNVTFNVTIVNNTLYSQYFHGVVYDETLYPSSSIEYTMDGLAVGDSLDARNDDVLDSVDFTITFTNVSEMPAIKFEFLPTPPSTGGGNEGGGEISGVPDEPVVTGALGKFKEILNNDSDHGALLDQMNDYGSNGRANSTYVGNVVGSSNGDTTLLNNLFTEGKINYLTLDLDGDGPNPPVNVTAMVKRENIDGNSATGDSSGREMVLYLTAEDPSQAEGGGWFGWQVVNVYAAVFTTNRSSNWVQIGDMYTGIADANAYSGGGGQNSFNTDTWLLNESVYGFSPAEEGRWGSYTGTGLSTVIQSGFMRDGTKYSDIINS